MTGPRSPGEITFYDVLGVPPDASGEQIREAFRDLVRILHPDRQSDPQLKAVADRQIRRYNRVYAVLSDARLRAAYDESLAAIPDIERAPIPAPVPAGIFANYDWDPKKLLARGGMILGIGFATFLMIWFAVGGNGSQEARGVSAGQRGTAAGDIGDEVEQLRTRIRTLETERDSAMAKLENHSAGTPPSSAATGPTFADASDFAGFWAFSRSTGFASSGGNEEYPPEYIELTVTEQSGKLQGKLHSRYLLLDRALSPNVDFEFAATPDGSLVNCPWEGPDGAKGTLTLQLLPGDSLELVWNASHPGAGQWLTAGKAILTKR